MRSHVFNAEQRIARPLPEVFEFFSRAGNLERITPPWLSFAMVGDEPAAVTAGMTIEYKLRLRGLPLRWVSQIDAFEPERLFIDRQLKGPYKLWVHRHEFEADGDGDVTVIRDEVHYQLPLGILGALARLIVVRRDLERIFAYRHQAVERLLAN
jgi:ligand-binding SRPBCC domain-containing protein